MWLTRRPKTKQKSHQPFSPVAFYIRAKRVCIQSASLHREISLLWRPPSIIYASTLQCPYFNKRSFIWLDLQHRQNFEDFRSAALPPGYQRANVRHAEVPPRHQRTDFRFAAVPPHHKMMHFGSQLCLPDINGQTSGALL